MENEELKWMANCIRRYCYETPDCEYCVFSGGESGLCGLRGYPQAWEGYEKKDRVCDFNCFKKGNSS